MCGIVGAVAQRDIADILLEGLRRLEYRGYDSAGMAVLDDQSSIACIRSKGKVQMLSDAVAKHNMNGHIGIAHTRWATHGEPSELNAHPHCSLDTVALVHNGIIENFHEVKAILEKQNYQFASQTDTEVAVHMFNENYKKTQDLLSAAKQTLNDLSGAFALGVIVKQHPDTLLAMRKGSPLVIGLGIGENFIASDYLALLPVCQRFIYLEDGDIAILTRHQVNIFDANANPVSRDIKEIDIEHTRTSLGNYRHYMLKEIFEQADVIGDTLEGRIADEHVMPEIIGSGSKKILDDIKRIQIVACGTSYHAGLVGKYWIESLAKLPCQVEIASEFRYRNPVVEKDTLFVTLSQSGETADTLAALRESKKIGYSGSLCICNVPESSLIRESDLCLMTHAGPEVGVASTKAFTTQLTCLLMLTAVLSKNKVNQSITDALVHTPSYVNQALKQNDIIRALANDFTEKHHALFLGRGIMYPIAMEGALKLKEISYIHAEAYPAGELKHGPLALVDYDMPVVVVAPNDELLGKLQSNLQEVQARGGQLYVFADESIQLNTDNTVTVITMPQVPRFLAPILYTIPLQLLAYYVAVNKGTDVDQPRNLAKSVTVE